VRAWRLAALLALAPWAAAAQSVDLARSEITFGFRQEGVPGSGKFRKFTADVGFVPARPEALRATIDVDVTSVDLGGDPSWNADIQAPSWFHTRQFPKASFVASGAKALGGGRFEAPAKFTLKGVTRDVVATFTSKAEAGGTLLEGVVPLKRTDYRVGDGAWADTRVVADEVAVRFKVLLKP
jgi:polyisoprenoid-binding protein YceI